MILPYEQKQNSMICMHSVVVVHRSRISLENRVMFNGSLFGFSMFNCMFNFGCGKSEVYCNKSSGGRNECVSIQLLGAVGNAHGPIIREAQAYSKRAMPF